MNYNAFELPQSLIAKEVALNINTFMNKVDKRYQSYVWDIGVDRIYFGVRTPLNFIFNTITQSITNTISTYQ